MAEKQLTPAQARALIKSSLNDGYRASQVKNIDKVKAVLTPEQIQKTIDSTLKGSTTAKDAKLNPKPNMGQSRISSMATKRGPSRLAGGLGGGGGGGFLPENK